MNLEEALARIICDTDPRAPRADAAIYVNFTDEAGQNRVRMARAWEARLPIAKEVIKHLQREGILK